MNISPSKLFPWVLFAIGLAILLKGFAPVRHDLNVRLLSAFTTEWQSLTGEGEPPENWRTGESDAGTWTPVFETQFPVAAGKGHYHATFDWESEEASEPVLLFRSSDHCIVWLNGEKLAEFNPPADTTGDVYELENREATLIELDAATLKTGKNHVAVEVGAPPQTPEGTSERGFFLQIEAKPNVAFDITRVGELPVLQGGRVKPLDSVARNTLMLTRNKRTVYDAFGRKQPAIIWFMDTTLDPRESNHYDAFRIDSDQVLGLLGQKQSEQKDFSFAELMPYFQEIEEAARAAGEKQQKELPLNPFEKDILGLHRALGTYLELTHSLHDPSLPGSQKELFAAYLNSIAGAIDSVRRAQGMPPADDPGLARFSAFVSAFERTRDSSLRIIPPASPEEGPEGWKTIGMSLIGESAVDAIKTTEIDPVVMSYGGMIDSFRTGDVTEFNAALSKIYEDAESRRTVGIERVHFEEFFNEMEPFYRSSLVYVIIFLMVCVSWLVSPGDLPRTAVWLTFAAFLVHTFGLCARMYIQDRPPVTSLYSSAIFIGWVAVLVGLVLEGRYKNGLGTAVAAMVGGASLVVAHNLVVATPGDTFELMRAVLDSNFWLSTHVVTVTIGYAATFIAGHIAVIYLLRKILAADAENERAVSGMVYGIVCFALLFSFVGTVLGGIWADQSWGRFWGWDPKENGALMIVLWNALILHARWGGIARARGIFILAVAGNIITAWSWFGTNMLGVGLHSYGFMDSAFFWLMFYNATMVAVMIAGYVFYHREPRQVSLAPQAS